MKICLIATASIAFLSLSACTSPTPEVISDPVQPQTEVLPEVQPEELPESEVPMDQETVEQGAIVPQEYPESLPQAEQYPTEWVEPEAEQPSNNGSDFGYEDPCANGSCENPNQPVFAPEKFDPTEEGSLTDPNPVTNGAAPWNW